MRRTAKALLAVLLVASLGAIAVPTASSAAASLSGTGEFKIKFAKGHPSSNAPCPAEEFCGVGGLSGYGRATITITDETFEEIDGSDCLAVTRVEEIALLDGSGVLVLDEAGTFCRPGGSGDSHATQFSYGSPGKWTFSFDVDGGSSSGVFAGATGTGSVQFVTAGGVGNWHLAFG